jgi:ferrous iron transport protein B
MQGGKAMTLKDLKTGEAATVIKVGGEGALRRRFLDMGITPCTSVELIKTAPMGDPVQIRLRGYDLTLRLDDAEMIEIQQV